MITILGAVMILPVFYFTFHGRLTWAAYLLVANAIGVLFAFTVGAVEMEVLPVTFGIGVLSIYLLAKIASQAGYEQAIKDGTRVRSVR